MAISEASLVERLGKSDRMVRNYAKTIEQVTGKNPQAGPREYHDWSLAEFDAIVAAGGPKAYERSTAPQPQPQPQPAPEPIAQPQPAAPAFQDVATAPSAIVPTFVVIDGGLATASVVPTVPTSAPILPMGMVGAQILQTTASAQMSTQAVGQMVGALKQRMSIGLDTLYAQDQHSLQAIEQLETQLVELEAMASEYDRAARTQSVKENLRADRVGKLTAKMGETAARLGFQLQPQSC